MQISKFPLWLCAMTLCGGMTVQAADTAAQAAARAALMQKMQQISGDTGAAPQTSIPAETAPAETKAPVMEKPAPSKPAPAMTAPAVKAPVATEAGDTPAQAAARAALEQKLQQMGGGTPATSSATSGTAPAQTETPAVTMPAPATTVPVTTTSGDTPAQSAARMAVERKLQQMGGSSSFGTAGEMQIVAPPPPVNASKLNKLSWLNSLYESNQISPEQYQQQRAAIMAEH